MEVAYKILVMEDGSLEVADSKDNIVESSDENPELKFRDVDAITVLVTRSIKGYCNIHLPDCRVIRIPCR